MSKGKFNRQVPSNQRSGKNSLILYGRHAVFAAIANTERQITKILCTKDNFEEIDAQCDRHEVDTRKINIVDRKEIDKILPVDAVHQGFAMYCHELPDYSIEEICDMAVEQERCHVLILDQVTDPQNIGAIIRSCAAFNTLALVIQDKNSPCETGSMAKAAAGALEITPVCRVTNLARAIEQLKEVGFWTVGMDGHSETTIDKLNKAGKTAIIMGSEGKGMRRLVEESCDSVVKLPISEKVESLNVSTAAAIALYEINKD